jgi:hypothetical protein
MKPVSSSFRLFLPVLLSCFVFAPDLRAQGPERQPSEEAIPVRPLREMSTPHTPTMTPVPAHPSFYDRKAEWRSIIRQFWGPGDSLAAKLEVFDLFQSYARSYAATFTWHRINWDSIASTLRSKITDSTSRGEFSRILNDLMFAFRDGHYQASDQTVMQTPTNPGTPLFPGFWWDARHAGVGTTPLADSTLLIYKAVPNHPLGLVPGDIIVGYQGVPWSRLVRELLDGGVPYYILPGAAPSAFARTLLYPAANCWHLFDTIDVVKHSTGQLVHLPLDAMTTLSAPSQYLNNEQLPVPGVAMPPPDQDFKGPAITYGIITGTNIGYIYVYHESYASVVVEFDNAVTALMGTDGLIIDLRINGGGGYALNTGISRLMNHATPTLVIRKRASPDDLYSLIPTSPSWLKLDIPADSATHYDRPIAVLLGSTCVSYGDVTSWQLGYVSNARMFGRAPWAIYSAPDLPLSPTRAGYVFLCANVTAVDHRAPDVPLWGQEYPLDEEVWLTPDDVANGNDTVVKRARAWIEHVAFAYKVRPMATYRRPGLDLNTVIARLRNPDGHATRIMAFVRQENGVLVDSLRMFDDGLHGDSLASDGLYGARIAPPATEDQYSVSVTTTDLTNGLQYDLAHSAHFFSCGPLKVIGYNYSGADTLLNPGKAKRMRLVVRNQGALDTLQDLAFRVTSLDKYMITPQNMATVSGVAPGTTGITGYTLSVAVDSLCPPGIHLARVETYLNTYPAWVDTLRIMVYPAVGVEELPTGIPLAAFLDQNYPNPFNPSTTIRYGLPERSHVSLAVYNTLGQKVAQVVSGEVDAGYHEVKFNAPNLPSGVYFYRLQAGSYVETKKLLLVR